VFEVRDDKPIDLQWTLIDFAVISFDLFGFVVVVQAVQVMLCRGRMLREVKRSCQKISNAGIGINEISPS
jgi:hypothetical protein